MRVRILLESLSSARQKYGKIADKMVEYDPTPTFKYTEWLCKVYKEIIQWKSGTPDFKNYVLNYLKKFDRISKNLEKKDIMQYVNFLEMGNAVDNYESKKESENLLRKIPPDAEKVFENDKAMVVRVDSYKASLFYGKGKFCIADTGGSDYWDNYTKEGNKFFYIIDKNRIKYPQVIQVRPGVKELENKNFSFLNIDFDVDITGWNSRDEMVPPSRILNFLGIPKDMFKIYRNIEDIKDEDSLGELEDLIENFTDSEEPKNLNLIKFILQNKHLTLHRNSLDYDDCYLTNAVNADMPELVRIFLKDGRLKPTFYELREACEQGLFEIVELLLKDGRVNPLGGKNLFSATLDGNEDVNTIIILLKDGRVSPTNRLLTWACEGTHTDIVKLILKDGRVIPTGNALHDAVSGGDLSIIKLILQNKEHKITKKHINYILSYLDEDAYPEMVKLLKKWKKEHSG